MTSDTQMYKDRYHIFNYFFTHRLSVTELCKLFNRSQTWFYKWKRRYDHFGEAGLRNIDCSPPAMPNRTPLDIEMKILDFIITYPTYGPQRIANELSRENVPVNPSAVYNVLKRQNLNTRT
ncbi:helix-turn-helix domain-containing protein [Candidatus Latescibacterota bacterium]